MKTFCTIYDAAFQRIRQNPQMYSTVYENYRRAIVRRFPYVIFYEVVDRTVMVYAVFHCSQDPDKWRSRPM